MSGGDTIDPGDPLGENWEMNPSRSLESPLNLSRKL